VSELVAAGEVARLGDLTDDDGVGVVLLAPVGHLLQRSLSSLTSDSTGAEVAVVHALERIDDQHERLVNVLRRSAELVGFLQEVGDIGLVANSKPLLEAQALADGLDLEE
jgi:hypothetical protein